MSSLYICRVRASRCLLVDSDTPSGRPSPRVCPDLRPIPRRGMDAGRTLGRTHYGQVCRSKYILGNQPDALCLLANRTAGQHIFLSRANNYTPGITVLGEAE